MEHESLRDEAFSLACANRKLRELAKYTLLCCECGVTCEACPLCGETGPKGPSGHPYVVCEARSMARALGVEVDG